MKPVEGRARVVIEEVKPQVDGGRYPVCRIVGDTVDVSAAIFGDGHDHLSARLLYRQKGEKRWRSAAMRELGNDLWSASFEVDKLGSWSFTIQAWVDHFDTWTSDLKKRLAAQPDPQQPTQIGVPQDIPLALRTGALLVEAMIGRAKGADARALTEMVTSLRWMAEQDAALYEYPLTPEFEALAARYPDLTLATKLEKEAEIWVNRDRARFSSWYELFPRSMAKTPGAHGTLQDVIGQLPEVSAMGFNVLYMPPIHPIGTAFRKGKNNSTTAEPGDYGSPWAIGAAPTKDNDGGHKAIHPLLGNFKDFDELVHAAKAHDMELALDIAFQCSPDHPWVKQHPTWFTIRPDGTIQYAENPPKKYQDIYPLNFESPDWRDLWDELCSVFEFWIKRGVKIFRVDNPHTKSLHFWEWCIGTVREKHPDVIFLAEAFTRPHVMYSLAKGGFTQSYTYFTWRTAKAEIETYLEEITQPPVSDFFQPNFWPNTPDILHRSLQVGGRAAHMQRVILAATLTANYGIYGPAYELSENAPMKPGPGKTETEEYLDSEKYEIRQRDRNAPGTLVPLITRLNHIRRANPALQSNNSLCFHKVDNPNLMCYSKSAPDGTGGENTILVAINLDVTQEQAGWIDLDLKRLNIPHNENFDIEDLLTGVHYQWHDRSNYVALRPEVQPAHIFRITRQAK
ncbi:alpha-1,4-glucan--maltose-1-phosphate maltosyltransferase [Granulicella tundricola]|uniref:Alpha-1,4-glucan:maltose-1-phosphate maltosyltransferase n=1 Tax=Granulicella tundricola (strain ATCC BAA-1859 / DSM 23138 / MP5ACTX9) TaxID=1198114 RepID=E8WYZ1_GRATM|nr:alpha-1,4-glucan--maltose-1-phosphate maltosyltransferase [Granulicella tundricola]ADW69906.1 alpha amylase catalytic region [Granulicella tundricola MP5ACTX9]